ncbi:hypothetical protein HPB47_003342, partial [Ixodes persulcatus]
MPPKWNSPRKNPPTATRTVNPTHPRDGSPLRAATPAGVDALTTALRAAFPEAVPRRLRHPEMAQSFPYPSDAEEEELLFDRLASQDPPGRYRAHIPEGSTDDSDSEADASPEQRRDRFPRQLRPRHATTGSRGQRLFTTTDPPTRRDFRNALVYVDRASRSSRYFGTRDVVELQLLEHFLQYSRGTPTRAPHSFSGPPSPLHTAPPLQPTVPHDPLDVEEEATRPQEEHAPALPPRRPRTPTLQSELFPPLVRVAAPVPTELFQRLSLWQTPGFAFLSPSPSPPSSPVSLPLQAATPPTSILMDRVITELDIVLHSPQPALIAVGDQQILAVLQDIVSPPDILLQALRAADVPLVPVLDPVSPQPTSESRDDSWAAAADRILRWLELNPVLDAPDSQDEELQDDDDSHQLPVLRRAVASMESSGLIKKTKRGPFLSPIQLAPKSATESRFVLDASHLTPHLAAPRFRLDPLPKVLLQAPLPPSTYFTKVDLAEALYHVSLHPQAQRLTTFRLDGTYYAFQRLPFGVRPAPFVMQALATAFARTLRSRGLWAWSYIDNFLLAHADPHFLQEQTELFLADLVQCGFRVNPKDTLVVPTRCIHFLGFSLDSTTATISHTPGRVKSLEDTLQLLRTPQPISRYQKLAGLWCFYFSLYRSAYHALRPLFDAALTGVPPPETWCVVLRKLWQKLPHSVPFVPLPPKTNFFADAYSTGFGVITQDSALAVITVPSKKIFLREAIAWLLAALLAPPNTIIHTDNLGLRRAITSGHLRALPWELC